MLIPANDERSHPVSVHSTGEGLLTSISSGTPNQQSCTRVKQWVKEGIALDNAGRFEEALTAYEATLRLNPNDANAHQGKGIVLGHLAKYQDALQTYEIAIRLNPNYALAYYGKSLALERLGKKIEAQKVLQKVKELGYKG